MDPYLEARWSDVHSKLIAFLGEAIQASLPSGLRARAEELVLLEEESDRAYGSRSDVAIVDSGRGAGAAAASPAGTAMLDPVFLEIPDAPLIDRFIKIIDRTSGNRVFTAIEVLSPWNKGPGRLNEDYRRKLADYARGEVSVVEIDLLRSSRARLTFDQTDLPPERRTPYLVNLHRSWRADRWEVYLLSLRAPLPAIPIPLRKTDKDLILRLQPLIERVYVAGGHDDIDHSKPPEPPLSAEDVAWADELLCKAGKR